MKIRQLTFTLIIAVFLLPGCTILEEMVSFSRCEFRLGSVENITLAGINVQQVSSLSDLSTADAARLTGALATGTLPLNLTLNVDIRNPNQARASMNRLDWIMLIDDKQIVQGTSSQRVEIAPNGGISTLPLSIEADLKSALSGKTGDALINFGLNLAGAGNQPTRITLRAKPFVEVGGREISYPGYLDIENEFTSN